MYQSSLGTWVASTSLTYTMPAGTCKHVKNTFNGRTGSQVDTPGMVELLLGNSKTLHACKHHAANKQAGKQARAGKELHAKSRNPAISLTLVVMVVTTRPSTRPGVRGTVRPSGSTKGFSPISLMKLLMNTSNPAHLNQSVTVQFLFVDSPQKGPQAISGEILRMPN